MKFDALFKKKYPEFFVKAQLNELFIKQVEGVGTEHYDSVISSIISVITNNEINILGQAQGSGASYVNDPLLGLYKAHCIDSDLRSIFMNMGASKVGIQEVDSLEYEFDIDFTEQKKELLNKNVEKILADGRDFDDYIKNESKKLSQKLLKQYQKKRVSKKITGNWLVFGKHNEKNIFLYLKVGYDHSQAVDNEIYQTLVDMYSEDFIRKLKSGK